MRIGTTGLNPLPNLPTMKKHNQKDLTQVKGGYVGAGFTFESVGSFLFMNLYQPKPLPKDIAERCIEALSHRLGQLEIDQCHNKIEWHVYLHEKAKLKLYLIYYRECMRLHEKGQRNG